MDTYRYITTNKLFFSGIAIAGICLSHLIGVDRDVVWWLVFYPGFVGVDFFLFYSGYGLCRSWESHTTQVFYLRRLKRVYPLLMVFTFLLYVWVYFGKHEPFTLFDIVCNLTTLSFWEVGGFFAEWYLSFIIYLYLLFPLLYKLVQRWRFKVLVSAFVALFIFLFFYRDGWVYQCAFSRVPIFLLGIICFQQDEFKTYKRGMAIFFAALLLMCVCYWFHIVQKIELVYMAAPFLLFLVAKACRRVIEKGNIPYRMFVFLGKYSLEIYLANMMLLFAMPLIHFPVPTALVYFTMQVILTLFFIGVKLLFQRL